MIQKQVFIFSQYFIFSFVHTDKKVVIVSVFGKSQYSAKGCKTNMLSSILQVGLLDEPEVEEESFVRVYLRIH